MVWLTVSWRFYLDPLPKLVVVGSNPIARSTYTSTKRLQNGFDTHDKGFSKGVSPFRGERTRGLAPSVGVGGRFGRSATECGSNPIARSKPHFVCAGASSASTLFLAAADKHLKYDSFLPFVPAAIQTTPFFIAAAGYTTQVLFFSSVCAGASSASASSL